MKTRTTVLIGDIHGCLDEFEELLKTISYNPEQIRLISVGDLMDRGPDSIGCVRRARELGIETLLGNHEKWHIRWRKHEDKRKATGKTNPMRRNDSKVRDNAALSDEDIQWMNNLPLQMHVKDNWFSTHAGCLPGKAYADQNWMDAVHIRYIKDGKTVSLGPNHSQPEGSQYWSELWDGPESIIYGHCVHSLERPRIDESSKGVQCVGIDTGCVFGGKLTAMFLESFAFVQIRAKKEYQPLHRQAED